MTILIQNSIVIKKENMEKILLAQMKNKGWTILEKNDTGFIIQNEKDEKFFWQDIPEDFPDSYKEGDVFFVDACSDKIFFPLVC